MWAALIRAIQIAGPISLGFVSSDFVTWLQGIPLIGGFFKKKDEGGGTPWYVTVIAIVGAIWVINLVLKRVFKSKFI